MINLLNLSASFLPEALTVTASIGDNVTISYTRKKVAEEDTIIYKDGMYASNRQLKWDFFIFRIEWIE